MLKNYIKIAWRNLIKHKMYSLINLTGLTIGMTCFLAKDFLKLFVIALLIATPIAYYFMSNWLQNYSYSIDIKWWVFLLVGVGTISVAFTTICFQSIKAALANPVKSLRTE